MKLTAAVQAVDALFQATRGLATAFAYHVFQPGTPFRTWYSTWPTTLFGASRPSDVEVTGQYGVYLIAESATDDVIYIGKATPRVATDATRTRESRYHLAAEIWSKMKTPTGSGAAVQFPHSGLLKPRVTPQVRHSIINGDVLVAVIRIHPWACAALVETYLQAAAFIFDGALPLANDQIG